MTSHKCAVHCAGKIGPLTRFTPISWSKVIASAEEWCKLSGPQCDVAHKVLSTCKEQPDSFEDIFYHRDCYAAFTNKTDIIRAKKRQMKLPQHKAVEGKKFVKMHFIMSYRYAVLIPNMPHFQIW